MLAVLIFKQVFIKKDILDLLQTGSVFYIVGILAISEIIMEYICINNQLSWAAFISAHLAYTA